MDEASISHIPYHGISQIFNVIDVVHFSGALRGKMAGLFFSTAGQHGGQETTALTFLTTLAHQGIIFVPMGAHDNLSLIDEVVGGSYYGCGTLSGVTGERKVTPAEREMALFQGEQFATALANYVVGARVRNSQSAAAIAANVSIV
jgi:NAD(P)H dehydrogenase (quinone)